MDMPRHRFANLIIIELDEIAAPDVLLGEEGVK
jgi:hypothetical protein